jgi:hypothetical protein
MVARANRPDSSTQHYRVPTDLDSTTRGTSVPSSLRFPPPDAWQRLKAPPRSPAEMPQDDPEQGDRATSATVRQSAIHEPPETERRFRRRRCPALPALPPLLAVIAIVVPPTAALVHTPEPIHA